MQRTVGIDPVAGFARQELARSAAPSRAKDAPPPAQVLREEVPNDASALSHRAGRGGTARA
eukprot:2565445-Alexandrium_andersonii.AAC.1